MTIRAKKPSNRIGYVFECGCKAGIGEKSKYIRRNSRIICRKHKSRIKAKVFRCDRCGKVFEDPKRFVLRCDRCREIVRLESIVKSNETKLFRETTSDFGYFPKAGFDQTRRADCVYGEYCTNRECFHGIRFNCFGCKRFELKPPMDIMDYSATGWTFEVPA